MALRVWLPLNGTLENKGIEGVQPTAGSTTINWNNNGKIGKCFEPTGADTSFISFIAPSLANKKVFSVAFWLYPDSTSVSKRDWATILRLMTGSGTLFFCTGSATSATTSVIMANNENDIWTGVNPATTPNTVNKWNHITVVADGSKVHFYNNGVEFAVRTQSTGHITGDIRLVNAMTGKMNDLRIYDHALSPKEVKEISQGLVLHYKLNSQYGLGLVNKYSSEYAIGKGNSYSAGYTVTKNDDGEGYNYSFSYTGTGSDSWPYIHFPNFTFTAGKTYIWQLKVRVNSCSNYALNARQARMDNDWERSFGQVVNSSLVGKGWKEYYVLQVLNEKSIRSGTEYTTNPCLELYPPSLKTEGTVYTANFDIKDVMICETDHYIPFIDNNLGCNYVVDSSGYGNDGIVTGSFTPESDSCRYDVSTKSLNGTDYIKSPLSLVDVQSFTCSFWVKPSSSNGGYSIVASNCNNPSSGFWISTNCESHALWFYNSAYADTVATSMSNDNWHHCAIVCNNKTFSMYIDGIQQILNRTTSSSKTITINNLSVFNSYTGTSWNTKRYGNISDFRFYISAISSEDILDLYHTSANIDDLGNLHSFEFIENDEKDSIYKNGIVSNGKNINYLVNNFAETNTMTDWTFGGTSPSISNGIVTLTGTSPEVTSKTFTVNPDDIFVIEIGVQLTQTSTTSGPGIYLGTKYGQSTNTFYYNFTTNKWALWNENNVNPYFMTGYNSTDYYHCKTYLLGSNKTIDDIPDAKATNTRGLYAIKLNSDTTTNIRSGYNQNTEMIIKLSDFKIYNLNQHGIVQVDNSVKTGYGYLQYNDFIEK